MGWFEDLRGCYNFPTQKAIWLERLKCGYKEWHMFHWCKNDWTVHLNGNRHNDVTWNMINWLTTLQYSGCYFADPTMCRMKHHQFKSGKAKHTQILGDSKANWSPAAVVDREEHPQLIVLRTQEETHSALPTVPSTGLFWKWPVAELGIGQWLSNLLK